jgi:hypothetical protein
MRELWVGLLVILAIALLEAIKLFALIGYSWFLVQASWLAFAMLIILFIFFDAIRMGTAITVAVPIYLLLDYHFNFGNDIGAIILALLLFLVYIDIDPFVGGLKAYFKEKED